jgi:hypothetical protein
MNVNEQIQTSAVLQSANVVPLPLDMRTEGPQNRPGRGEEEQSLARNRTPLVQVTDRHISDSAKPYQA